MVAGADHFAMVHSADKIDSAPHAPPDTSVEGNHEPEPSPSKSLLPEEQIFEIESPKEPRSKPQFGSFHQRTTSEKTLPTVSLLTSRSQKRMSLVFEPTILQDSQNSPRQLTFPPFHSLQTSPRNFDSQDKNLSNTSLDYTHESEQDRVDFDYIAGTDFAPLVFSSQSNSPPNLSSTGSPRNLEFQLEDKLSLSDKGNIFFLSSIV